MALPAGRLATAAVNTVALLQAARPERAHLHAEREPESSGDSLRRGVRQSATLALRAERAACRPGRLTAGTQRLQKTD